MANRVKGFAVTFDKDISEEDAEALRGAINCLKHVLEVSPVTANIDDQMNRTRIRWELTTKLLEVVQKET